MDLGEEERLRRDNYYLSILHAGVVPEAYQGYGESMFRILWRVFYRAWFQPYRPVARRLILRSSRKSAIRRRCAVFCRVCLRGQRLMLIPVVIFKPTEQ